MMQFNRMQKLRFTIPFPEVVDTGKEKWSFSIFIHVQQLAVH